MMSYEYINQIGKSNNIDEIMELCLKANKDSTVSDLDFYVINQLRFKRVRALELEKLKECLVPGVDAEFKTRDGLYDVFLFWHMPSINLGCFPILQINRGNKTVFHREGSENPDHWCDLIDIAIEKLC